jgi:hypothetical protein
MIVIPLIFEKSSTGIFRQSIHRLGGEHAHLHGLHLRWVVGWDRELDVGTTITNVGHLLGGDQHLVHHDEGHARRDVAEASIGDAHTHGVFAVRFFGRLGEPNAVELGVVRDDWERRRARTPRPAAVA